MRGNRAFISSALVVAGIFVILLVLGIVVQSGPSAATVNAGRVPTTTSTTEPPPEGVVVVEMRNGSFSPANLTLNTEINQIVRWVNRDPRDVRLFDRSPDQMFDVVLEASGGEFEWNYGDLTPGLWRYQGEIGRQLVPGQVDTRPAQ